MSKLNQGELLGILETAFSHLLKDVNWKETRVKHEQAKEQIKEMIQKPEVTEEWIEGRGKMQYCQACKHWNSDNVENGVKEENVYELTPTGAIWGGYCMRRNIDIWEFGNCGYFRKSAP